MYQALYRKYRPQTFDDMVGQDAVTRTLRAQLTSGKLSHAYLFTGSRGTGKTTAAKILAKAVNCLEPADGNPCNRCAACKAIDSGACMDVLEIDAASNNGVDQVRDLRDDAVYTPSQVRTRVYIIDEVHMLSLSAFNALLKIIEEPPEHLLFILATTELQKVPATIVSRCQRFAFRRPSMEEIDSRLQYIAYQEGVELEPEASRVLARLADGAFRDGINLLDQCMTSPDKTITPDWIYQCLGIAGQKQTAELLSAAAAHDTQGALKRFSDLYAQGKDIAAMLDELCAALRDLLILKTAPAAGISMLSGVCTEAEAKELTGRFTPAELVRMLTVVQGTLSGFTRSGSRRIDAELCLMELCDPALRLDAPSLNARLSRVEEQLASGILPARAEAPRQAGQAPSVPDDTDAPPPFSDEDAPPDPGQAAPALDVAWPEIAARVRSELKPPLIGFFAPSPKAPVQGRLRGDTLYLLCSAPFVLDMVGSPELLALVGRKAQAVLGRQVQVKAVDSTSAPGANANMQQLLAFGKAHEQTIKIKE